MRHSWLCALVESISRDIFHLARSAAVQITPVRQVRLYQAQTIWVRRDLHASNAFLCSVRFISIHLHFDGPSLSGRGVQEKGIPFCASCEALSLV